MNKTQVLILLLIIALAFYYLSAETKSNFGSNNLIKPQPPEPTSIINIPSDQPVKELPQPTKFKSLNPPHSQVDEPWEPPKPPPEPKPIKTTLNCPSAEVSELSEAEKLQRQAQELSDYHWLLNNKTIADWHHEHQLTDAQFQVLRGLVDNEEMNTLSYFLNLLPVNYEWTLIGSEFKDQTLIESWTNLNFTYQQTQDWLKIGFQLSDYALVAWIRDIKKMAFIRLISHPLPPLHHFLDNG